VPQSVFVKREPNTAGGSRWQTADGKATLDTTALPKGGETLQQLYDKVIVSSNPARKVTYKLLRPDFFVVTGETPTGKFYRRMSLGSDGVMRGFSVGYDKALAAEMDKLVISVANSFDPFPGATAVASPARAPGTVPPAVSTPAVPATPRERLATAFVLEGGHLLTSAAALAGCKTLVAGPRKLSARLVASDSGTGLALLKAEGLVRSSSAASAGGPVAAEASLTLVSQAWVGNAPSGVFAEALAVGDNRIAAPLQPGGAGAALFNERGALAGLVVDDPGTRKQVAGVVPVARYRFATAEEIGAFLQKNGIVSAKTESVVVSGSIAAARRDAIISLVCSL
jgi:hypothetical protein